MAAGAINQVAKKSLLQTWYRVEVLPIIAVIGFALGGCGWYVSRLARGPDVIWDRRRNPTPWENVDQNTNLKMFSVNKEFEKSYSRGRL
ncbi:hypothetical protein CONCODRAFT_18101 [Conidiobolus coronatus NRRL 28638]|uniref:Uncharacterized protein n=1 Tax=Conidiobolus coronatus (strain ATCC 28846 / CBS 209.66 / NRRL 28638) TaxID=796925 RepID=A0A137P403_CONC2|nr:hypothetical protein CONCODRAFT_18101 [Conidiobolus coronatus NRRL 28638]|eukprot:KXN69760.1 hypothetical protein CONCODRAFT_18101 [Conidiobolus coronatus NRRL 28638]